MWVSSVGEKASSGLDREEEERVMMLIYSLLFAPAVTGSLWWDVPFEVAHLPVFQGECDLNQSTLCYDQIEATLQPLTEDRGNLGCTEHFSLYKGC